MSDCTSQQIQDWTQQHTVIDDGIMGKVRGLTLAQKQKLTVKIDQWIANLNQQP